MSNPHIDTVADIAMAANRQFNETHSGAHTQVGAISSNLRRMNVAADAVNIDDMHSGKRLALIIMDQNPEMVGIGIGQKETIGDYEMITQMQVDELTQQFVFEILDARFVHAKH